MSDPNAPQPDDAAAAAPQPPVTPPPAAPQYAPAPAAAPFSAESDRQLAMWSHIGGVIGFLPSLIIWLIGKDRGPRTNVEAKEALNWQITFTIIYVAILIVSTILGAVVWVLGLVLWLLPLAWWVLNIVWSIMGGMKVNAGGSYRYPFNFRIIK